VRRIAPVVLLAAAALLLSACATAPPAAPPAGTGTAPQGSGTPPAPPGDAGALPASSAAPFTTPAARFTDRALKQERAGELRLARDSWGVVAALRTDAAEPKRRVAALTAQLAAEAEKRYRAGLDRLQEGDTDAARRELLLALAADPDHAAALDALKNRLEPDAEPVTVAAGDSFESIARKHYGDADKAALVARVNDLDPAGRPAPGTVLSLPSLAPPAKPAAKRAPEAADAPGARYDTEPAAIGPEGAAAAAPAAVPETPQAPDPAEAQLARARGLFEAKKFEEAAAAAEKLAGSPTVGAKARELAGNAWFAAGDAAVKEERYADALAAYRKAEPARKDAAAAGATVVRLKKEKAEELYNAGVRLFINQDLQGAISSWEQTLALNPEHPKAPKDIEKARALQQKLKELK
jgi:tetratricopeptide (TPR) repeat protein